MVKKARKPPMEASPSAAGEDARARFRYHYLLQDYEELLRETEARKRKLQELKQNKLRLLGEVKFLRRRYTSLSRTPSQTYLYNFRKQFHKTPVPSAMIIQPARPQVPNGVLIKEKNHIAVSAAKPTTCTLLDLNQTSLQSSEQREFETQMEPPKPEMLKRCSMDDAQNEPFTICRNVGNNSNRAGKRKIRWQDPVALRV